jgi:hypothetical protein
MSKGERCGDNASPNLSKGEEQRTALAFEEADNNQGLRKC